MIDLTIKLAEFRKKIYKEEALQNFIRDILIIAGGENSKRALYTIVYSLVGEKTFPSTLREKITLCMEQNMIEKTFLDRNNYEQRVYGMLSIKDRNTGEYRDLYYRDVLINLGKGTQAKKTGRGLSAKRRNFLKEEICEYSILQALDEIVKQFSNNESPSKYEEVCIARNRVLLLSEHFTTEDFIAAEEERKDERDIEEDTELSETEKQTLILARKGQGKFRKDVIERNICCPFTGINNPKFLIASHIKPWKVSNNQERLDGNNGFAFTPTYDRLFDQGFISFDDNKRLLVSSELDKDTICALALQEGKIIEKLVLSDKCKKYLAFHRDEKFKK